MHRSCDGTEPKLSWDSQAESYDNEAERRQLSASLAPESLQRRGLLKLSPRSQRQGFNTSTASPFHSFSDVSTLVGTSTSLAKQNHVIVDMDLSVQLTEGSSGMNTQAFHSHTSLFQDTLRATSSAALAPQALLARLCQTSYYDGLILREIATAPAHTSFSCITLVPLRWTGFARASTRIALHIIVVIIVTVLFLNSTISSSLGHS